MTAAVPTPRRLPLRFSLRVLLLVVTAFAIGFPIWYRWPYEESQDASVVWDGNDPFAGRLSAGPPTQPIVQKQTLVTTWQRQWGGGRLKHGNERLYDDTDQVIRELEFAGGQQLINGRPVEDRLGQLVTTGDIHDPVIVSALLAESSYSCSNSPLFAVVEHLSQDHHVPIFFDALHTDRELPISTNLLGMQLSAGLAWLAAEHDLACDYRYGCVWITSADDAQHWHDPTGVSDIVPPGDSQLARSWKETVSVAFVDNPLHGVIQRLAQSHAIEIDVSRLAPIYVTARFEGVKFHDVLGILLYQSRCRCKLEGETLVILPPEEMP